MNPASGDGRDLAVVSDLHLSSGAAGDDRGDPGAFGRFLHHLGGSAAGGARSRRLLVLGDCFDLAHGAGGPRHRSANSERDALAEFDRITHRHPHFFAGLARFLEAGGAVDIVPGNHDVELLFPSVEAAVRRTIVAAGTAEATAAARLCFHRWIYYEPGFVYAEHGSQYHDINTFATWLRPFDPADPGRIDPPLGRAFERYLTGRGAGQRSGHLDLARSVLRYARRLSTPELKARRKAYRDEILGPFAAEVGLSRGVVVALDALAATTPLSIAQRLVRRAVLVPVGRLVTGRAPFHPGDRSAYLRRVWPRLRQLLEADGAGVPFYVFGHTHHPEQIEEAGAQYLNSGTWLTNGCRGVHPGTTRTFVEITRLPRRARLLRWDDTEGTRRSAASSAATRTTGDGDAKEKALRVETP